jgi:hypothetical protein
MKNRELPRITIKYLEPCDNCGNREFHMVNSGIMYPRGHNIVFSYGMGERSTDDVISMELRCCDCGEEIEDYFPREECDIRIIAGA